MTFMPRHVVDVTVSTVFHTTTVTSTYTICILRR